MPMNPTTKARLLRRSSRATRGAGLVEAAVAIPVMLIFLGTTIFAHKSDDEKLAQQASTRSEILYYGSHNCEANAPAEMSQQVGDGASGGTSKQTGASDTTEGGGGEVDKTATKLRES